MAKQTVEVLNKIMIFNFVIDCCKILTTVYYHIRYLVRSVQRNHQLIVYVCSPVNLHL